MTKEEAKKYLIDISYALGNMSVVYLTEKDGEKMREAIEALEQEPCDDTISRQAAIDCVTYYTPPSKIRNEIAELPSVTSKQSGWIPVSELPRENGWYQCTVIINDLPRTMELFYKNDKWLDNQRIDMFNTYDIYGYGYIEEKHKLSYQELISEFDWTKYVIAWMPLSEPYKVERSGEDENE